MMLIMPELVSIGPTVFNIKMDNVKTDMTQGMAVHVSWICPPERA
jgi:hypothetical protein